MNRGRAIFIAHCVCALFVLLHLGGCEEDIALVEGTEMPFTLYGLLTPMTDTQYVHVFPIDGKLEQGTGSKLDVEFTSTDLETGEVRVWADSVVQDSRGVFGHVFWSPFRAAYGGRYRIEAIRPDQRSSHVEVEVPEEVEVRAGENRMQPRVVSEMRLVGATPKLLKVEVSFFGRTITGYTQGGIPIFENQTVKVDYEHRVVEGDQAFSVPVDLNEAYALLKTELGKRVNAEMLNSQGIDLLLVTLEVIVASDDWSPPEGRLDVLALAHPNVMRNVQNGYGFVGAGYPVVQKWRPHFELREAAGFVSHV